MEKQEKINFLIGTGLPIRWKVSVEALYKTFDEFYSTDVLYREKVQYIADNNELYPNYQTLVRVKNLLLRTKKDYVAYNSVNNGDYYMRLIEANLADNTGFTFEDIGNMVVNSGKSFLNQN
jgi:hypothetical protein